MVVELVSNDMQGLFSGGTVKKRIVQPRPEEEWMHISIPPIVSADLWATVDRMGERNARASKRNARTDYPLTGLVKCATCGYSYCGHRRTFGNGKKYSYADYSCSGSLPPNALRMKKQGKERSSQASVRQEVLEDSVWAVICHLLTDPTRLLEALDNLLTDDTSTQLEQQVQFIQNSLRENDTRDEHLLRAYLAGAFSETEYAEQRQLLKTSDSKLKKELEDLLSRRVDPDDIMSPKNEILRLSEEARATGDLADAPFERKKRIVKSMIDRIDLNAHEGWFELQGIMDSTWLVNVHQDDDGGTGGDGDGSQEERLIAGNTARYTMSIQKVTILCWMRVSEIIPLI